MLPTLHGAQVEHTGRFLIIVTARLEKGADPNFERARRAVPRGQHPLGCDPASTTETQKKKPRRVVTCPAVGKEVRGHDEYLENIATTALRAGGRSDFRHRPEMRRRRVSEVASPGASNHHPNASVYLSR